MDAQAKYMFQRNPNERGPNGPQRPNGGGNGPNGNGGDHRKVAAPGH